MRGDSGKRFIFLLSGMLLAFMLFGQVFYVKAEKKSEPKTLTFSKKIDLIKEVKKKKIEDIVVILAANWPGEKSAELIVSTLKKLAKKSGCRVYYVNTLPYVHKGIYKNRTTVMTYHNKMTEEGF